MQQKQVSSSNHQQRHRREESPQKSQVVVPANDRHSCSSQSLECVVVIFVTAHMSMYTINVIIGMFFLFCKFERIVIVVMLYCFI